MGESGWAQGFSGARIERTTVSAQRDEAIIAGFDLDSTVKRQSAFVMPESLAV